MHPTLLCQCNQKLWRNWHWHHWSPNQTKHWCNSSPRWYLGQNPLLYERKIWWHLSCETTDIDQVVQTGVSTSIDELKTQVDSKFTELSKKVNQYMATIDQHNVNLTMKFAGIVEHQNSILATIASQVQTLLSIMQQNFSQNKECIDKTFTPLIPISPTPPSSKHQNRSKSAATTMIKYSFYTHQHRIIERRILTLWTPQPIFSCKSSKQPFNWAKFSAHQRHLFTWIPLEQRFKHDNSLNSWITSVELALESQQAFTSKQAQLFQKFFSHFWHPTNPLPPTIPTTSSLSLTTHLRTTLPTTLQHMLTEHPKQGPHRPPIFSHIGYLNNHWSKS